MTPNHVGRGRVLGAGLTLAVLCAADAAGSDRLRIAFDGGWAPRDQLFERTVTYPEFAETTRVSARHATGSKKYLAGEVQLRVLRHLGVALAFGGSDTAGTATVEAGVPHPLYLNRDRALSADLTGVSWNESAVHADLVALHASGRWRLRAFAGLSFFKLETRLVDRVTYRHAYPYDEVELATVVLTPAEGSATGFNLGAGVDWRFARRVGLGVQARFARATVDLSTPAGGAGLRLEPGGLAGTAGLRLFF